MVVLKVADAKIESCYGIYVLNQDSRFTDKDILLLGLYDQFRTATLFEPEEKSMVFFNPLLPLMKITLPCGHSVVYRSLEEIPEESVPCSCGNAKHWFIKYE